MKRFLVLNQEAFDGHPGAPESPMHKVYAWPNGEPRWEDISADATWSVIVEADNCRLAFIKAMGMEPHSQTATSWDGVTSFHTPMFGFRNEPVEYKHVWVIELGHAAPPLPNLSDGNLEEDVLNNPFSTEREKQLAKELMAMRELVRGALQREKA